MTKGAEKLGMEKDEFMKKFDKTTDDIRKVVENQYDTLFQILCDKADSDPEFDALVCQEHKTWSRCYKYVEDRARKMAASGNMAMVEDAIVFQWISEYYSLDDKAQIEVENKKKTDAEAKRKADAQKRKDKEQKKATKAVVKAAQVSMAFPEEKDSAKDTEADNQKPSLIVLDKTVKEMPKPKANKSKDVDGQMSFFDMFSSRRGSDVKEIS